MSQERPPAFGALSDIRVLDLTQMLAGPFGTMILADHGADVIKVESVNGGDMTRVAGPYHADDQEKLLNGYFQSVNRNKRSISLNLKTEQGRQALLALVKDADALVENFRAGVMDRLGLSYETLRAVNPKLVYGALRGFGDPRTGASPYGEWPAFDVVAQAMGGIMAITGPLGGPPTKVGPGVGDLIPGMMLAFGVLSAVHNARRTGEGQFVDVSMVDAVLAICERTIWQNSVEKIIPAPDGNHHPFLCPFGVFPASDGHITVAAHDDVFFGIFCKLLDIIDLPADGRFLNRLDRTAHRAALVPLISAYTSQFTRSELMTRLGGKIPFAPVLDVAEIMADPHAAAREMIVEVAGAGMARSTKVAGIPIKMTGTPGGIHRRAPLLGEHTIEELVAAGFSREDIDLLIASGAAASTIEAEL
ncbi:CoA transferase [Sphingobium sp. 3R8]|uniref:CaiB/BaiF CoA transferase family protein n=1 Tax=Sphingobium sp. 3R8 TaxID=2874921 RepID=UPI001CC93B6E|nr:CoA transferase [Sphingobium sp. 3R8]MBZ9646891.1 CoA transferase [Sphingobium sp. 3R8]